MLKGTVSDVASRDDSTRCFLRMASPKKGYVFRVFYNDSIGFMTNFRGQLSVTAYVVVKGNVR